MSWRSSVLSGRTWTITALALCAALCLSAASFAASRDDWQQPERVMADLGLNPGACVADVGCGRGYFTFRMAKAVGDQGKVFAVDIDDKALQAVREEAERQKLSNVLTIHSEPTDTKLVAESVDVAFVCDVVHHVPEAQRQPLFESIARALKPGGYLYVIDFKKTHDNPHHKYEELVAREDVIKVSEAVKLTLDAEWYYLADQYFLRFRKPPAQ